MAANVITRLRRTPTTAHSHIASEPHFSFCKEMHLPRSHSLHFRIVNILYRAVVMIYPVSASFFCLSHIFVSHSVDNFSDATNRVTARTLAVPVPSLGKKGGRR